MRIAFYAPLKSPDHPVPSGDRRMARLFMEALRRAGHEVVLASSFRSYDGAGNVARQARLRHLGAGLASRFVDHCRANPPDLWFSYHLYHKAPDWLGPEIARRLAIPYVVAEASFAPKQCGGPWAMGHEAVAHAVRNAERVICVNPDDAECLRRLQPDDTRLVTMKPFIDTEPAAHARAERTGLREALTARLGIDSNVPWIAVAAMMRRGDKLASYRLLGDALRRVAEQRWVLLVAGDGPARDEVAVALDFGERVRFLGALEQAAVDRLHAAADIGAWPAVNEAYGMALLEAQAAGLPLVAGDRAGVRQIVGAGETALLVPPGDTVAFASALASLLDAPERRAAMAAMAVARVQKEHGMPAAIRHLDAAVAAARAERLQMVAS